ncbi:hypothetical protein niasHT_032266 [Heterodera trifolii]|uniref:Uncharacterized protein n=1 Tax=Heterodera trifolii TaxID=157864 RepID=A0ABD2HUC8_9BILA
MCGAGYAAFEQHADCFAEVENREQYVHCKRTASRAMDSATAELGEKRGGIDGEQYMEDLQHHGRLLALLQAITQSAELRLEKAWNNRGSMRRGDEAELILIMNLIEDIK